MHFFNCTSLGLQDFTAISTTKKKTRVLLLKSNLVSRFARKVQSKRCRMDPNGANVFSAFWLLSQHEVLMILIQRCCDLCEFHAAPFANFSPPAFAEGTMVYIVVANCLPIGKQEQSNTLSRHKQCNDLMKHPEATSKQDSQTFTRTSCMSFLNQQNSVFQVKCLQCP